MNKLALHVRRLNFQFPEFKQHHGPLNGTLSRLAQVKVADARDYLAPGLSEQQMDFIMDIAFEAMYHTAYRDGYVGSITDKSRKAFVKFGEDALKALMAYALDPANVDNVRWDLFYLNGKPFDTTEQDKYQEALAKYDAEVAELDAAYDLAMADALMEDRATLRDVKSPDYPTPPKAPKPTTKLDADAEMFIESMVDDMDDFAYELYMNMDGHGTGLDDFDMLFYDSYDAAKAIGRSLQKAHRAVQEALYDDMSTSVESEKEERRIRKVEEALDAYTPDRELLRGLRAMRGDKDAEKALKMLRAIERAAVPEADLAGLKKLKEMAGKAVRELEKMGEPDTSKGATMANLAYAMEVLEGELEAILDEYK